MKKAFLLGAGLGTRLRPMTHVVPKPLIPVFHRPLITYTMDQCLALGIEEIAINTHHLPECWPEAFPEGSYRGIPLHFFHEETLLETGGGIKNIESWIDGDDLLVMNGDILSTLDLASLIKVHESGSNIATLGLRSEGPHCNVALENEQVIDMRHARGIHPGTHQFTGIYCLSAEILSMIPAHEKVSIVPAFLELAKLGQIGGHLLDEGDWLDLGTRETYLAVHQRSDLGPAIHPSALLGADALISNSVIGPNCKIGERAQLKDCLLWPNAQVAADAVLTNCIIHSSNVISGQSDHSDL